VRRRAVKFGALGLLLFLFWQGGDLLFLLSAVCGGVTEVSALRVCFLSVLSGLTGASVPVCVTASDVSIGELDDEGHVRTVCV